jgi:hypothetical protein
MGFGLGSRSRKRDLGLPRMLVSFCLAERITDGLIGVGVGERHRDRIAEEKLLRYWWMGGSESVKAMGRGDFGTGEANCAL